MVSEEERDGPGNELRARAAEVDRKMVEFVCPCLRDGSADEDDAAGTTRTVGSVGMVGSVRVIGHASRTPAVTPSRAIVSRARSSLDPEEGLHSFGHATGPTDEHVDRYPGRDGVEVEQCLLEGG